MKIFVPKLLGFTKLSHSSDMQDDGLMHREGLMSLFFPLCQIK